MSWLAPRPAQQRLTIGAAGAGSLLAVGVAGEATRGEDNSEAASASRLRRVVQLTPVFAGRQPEPALAGPEEAALLGKSEQVGRLAQRKVEPVEVLVRPLMHSSRAIWSRRGSPSGRRRMIASRTR